VDNVKPMVNVIVLDARKIWKLQPNYKVDNAHHPNVIVHVEHKHIMMENVNLMVNANVLDIIN